MGRSQCPAENRRSHRASGIEIQVTATCTPNSTYDIGLNEGRSPGATIKQRRLVSGAQYRLHSDSRRSNTWGNTPGADTVTGTGTGASEDHTVFGSVPATQITPAGDYTRVDG